MKLSNRENLSHAGKMSHDDAVIRAMGEYPQFSRVRAELPDPVEAHFEEAIVEVKQLEKAQRVP